MTSGVGRGSRPARPEARPPPVARVLRHVAAAARRHAMFGPGGRVLVAVSGGPDSLCLLHSMARLRRLLKVEPVCFHFDHRLREDSERDAVYVRGQAANLGIPFVPRQADSAPSRGASVEAWARGARYAAMSEGAIAAGARVAAVGHTADDQAETILLALLRGGGVDALSGMSPVTPMAGARVALVRPLLEVTREETEAFCRALHLRPRRDPMNQDPSFLRVGVRTRVIPFLEDALGRNVRASLVRTAALLRADAELLDRLAAGATGGVVIQEAGDTLLRADALRSLDRPLSSRIVRGAVLRSGAVPEVAHVEAVLSLASGRTGRRVSLPSGLLARREREYVRLTRTSPERADSARA